MPEVNWETVKAVAVIVVTAIVNVANVLGYAMDADTWVNATLSILSAVSIAWSWWRNNNVTLEAQTAQVLLDDLKDARRSGE